jgi:hypothetical protein
VKDVESEAVPTLSGEFQTLVEGTEAPATVESFSHGADPAIMDMTQSILGQLSHFVPPPKPDPEPKPGPEPKPERRDRTKYSFAAAATETDKRAKYSFAAAMKEEG